VRIISLGGSLINKNKINTTLLREFRDFIVKSKEKFLIVTGGGSVARNYQKALREITTKKSVFNEDLLGIKVTELNALFLSMLLNAQIVSLNNLKTKRLNKNLGRVLVSYGDKPGHTTDFVAVEFARIFGEKEVINMSRIKYVRKNSIVVKKITWKDYLSIIPKKHTPGVKVPFDVEASKVAMRENIDVVFVNSVKSLRKYIRNGCLEGTIISNCF